MGNCCTRAYINIFGWMMAGRNAEPRICQQSTPRSHLLGLPDSGGDPARSVMDPHEDDDICILVSDSTCDPARSVVDPHENDDICILELTEEPLPLRRVSMFFSRLVSKLKNDSRKETETKLGSELKEKTTLIDELRSSQKIQDHHIRNLNIDLDQAHRSNQEIQAASGKKVQQLKSIIEEKEKDLKAEKFHASQFKAKCLKLEKQLALIEKQAAEESRTSGSYTDDHANPGMLEGACKAADKVIDALARFLHSNSVTKVFALRSPELEQFVRRISPAHPADFSRAIQVKYVWAHWICHQMFRGFEHVFFDVDGGQLTSPLDSQKHALECFRGFQQKQTVFSLDLFQAFCSRKYKSVFPPSLVSQAFIPPGITCNENGRFQGDGELYALFMDVARAVWLLHELAFSFDPPASILRMARGTPYDKQFHEPVIHVEDGHGLSSQLVSLMVRPTFRVRKSIIRSRVFLCNNRGSPSQA